MIRNLLVVLLFSLAVSCSNNRKEEKENNISEENETLTEKEKQERLLSRSFNGLFRYFEEQDPSFRADKFDEFLNAEPLDTLSGASFDEKTFSNWVPFLIYNADSTGAIDLYSYNYIQRKINGATRLHPAGPDVEVAYIDLVRNERTRILYSGPSLAVLDAVWVNNETAMVAVSELLEGQSLRPVIYRYHFPERSVMVSRYEGAVEANPSQYPDPRIGGIRAL